MTPEHGQIYFAADEVEARKLCIKRSDGADRIVFSRDEVELALARSRDLDFDLLEWLKTLILIKRIFPTARVDSVKIQPTLENQTDDANYGERKGVGDEQGKFFDESV